MLKRFVVLLLVIFSSFLLLFIISFQIEKNQAFSENTNYDKGNLSNKADTILDAVNNKKNVIEHQAIESKTIEPQTIEPQNINKQPAKNDVSTSNNSGAAIVNKLNNEPTDKKNYPLPSKVEHSSKNQLGYQQNNLGYQQNNIAESVGALGRIEPASRIIFVSHDAGPEGAKIAQIYVNEGDNVKANDKLARLSNYDKNLAELELAKANLQMQHNKIDVQYAEEIRAGQEMARITKLFTQKAISESQLQDTKLRFMQAKANTAALNAEYKAFEAKVSIAETQFAKNIINAPISGTIIKIHARNGERVGDKGVVEMADLENLEVVAEVYEKDIGKVKIGKQAFIMIDGIKDEIIGQVKYIAFQVYKNDLNDTDPLANRDNRIVEVRIDLPKNSNEQLKHMLFRQVQVRIKG